MAISRDYGYPTRHVVAIKARMADVPTAMVEIELQNAWRDLAQSTTCWREAQAFTLTGTETVFPLTPRDYASIDQVLTCQIDGRAVYFWAGDRSFFANRTQRIDASDPTCLKFGAQLNTPGEMLVLLALRPKDDADADPRVYIPSDLQGRYFEPILEGALYRLYEHRDKPYGNLQLAEDYKRRFHASLTRTKHNVRSGNTFATPTPWVYPTQVYGRTRTSGQVF